MQLGIPAAAAAVLEQPRIIASDALEERFDRVFDLSVAGGRVPE
jgi:hypothetical protein